MISLSAITDRLMKTFVNTLVGHGCTLIETTPFDRRVVGSNPVLATM